MKREIYFGPLTGFYDEDKFRDFVFSKITPFLVKIGVVVSENFESINELPKGSELTIYPFPKAKMNIIYTNYVNEKRCRVEIEYTPTEENYSKKVSDFIVERDSKF